jgi:hypothetical protein
VAKELIADSWVAIRAQFDDDDLDTVFRLRTQMPIKKVRSQHPIMMIIKWPYPAKKDGMPRQADMKRMGSFEDALEDAIEAPRLGIQVACLTGNGRRTWRYFVADPDAFLHSLHPLLQAHAPEPHLFRQIEDPDWEGLGELLPLLECEHDEG